MSRKPSRRISPDASDSTPLGFLTISVALYRLAVASASRAKGLEADAVETVVLSAMWLEAYANQIATVVGIRESDVPAGVLALRQAASEKDDHIDGKIAQIFTDLLEESEREVAWRRTADLRKDVRLLYDVRNALAHLRPVAMRGSFDSERPLPNFFKDPYRLAKRLAASTLTKAERESFNSRTPWTDFLYREATSGWALKTATEMATILGDCFPSGRLRAIAQQQNPARDEFWRLHGLPVGKTS
jgi:hypothetical protein